MKTAIIIAAMLLPACISLAGTNDNHCKLLPVKEGTMHTESANRVLITTPFAEIRSLSAGTVASIDEIKEPDETITHAITIQIDHDSSVVYVAVTDLAFQVGQKVKKGDLIGRPSHQVDPIINEIGIELKVSGRDGKAQSVSSTAVSQFIMAANK